MIDRSLTDTGKEKIVRYIGDIYQRSRKRMDIYTFQNCIRENQKTYNCDQGLVHLIDRTLADCTADTRCIIRRHYLEKNDPDWFLNYFARSTFYRLRKLAVQEFIRCLDI